MFDVYTGAGIDAGKKSLAISVTLQPTEKTLTEQEIDAVGQKIVASVAKQTGGVLRSWPGEQHPSSVRAGCPLSPD